MKKTLILAYDFPPYVSVGGLRPASWAKYMHEFGIFPIVVTRQWDNKYGNALDYIAPSESKEIIIENTDTVTIIRTPYKPNLANKILLKYGNKKYKLIRKFVTAFYETFQWIFNIGTKSQIYFAAKNYLKNNNVDCIIATGDPFILFRYASKLSKKFNIPWIADYRDPWSQTYNHSNKIFLKWNEINEKIFLKNVSLITTVSAFFKFQIERLVKNKNFQIITNGYDDNIPILAENIKQNSKVLNIGFAGTIYKWHPVEVFLKTINKFITENNFQDVSNSPSLRGLCGVNPHFQREVKLNFYGINIPNELQNLIAEKFPNLKKHINIFPKLKNEKYIQEAAKNNVFLLFNDSEYIGTKIYDYMAMKRKIILCFSNDEESKILKQNYYPYKNQKEFPYSDRLQIDLIEETNSGIIVENSEKLYNTLESLNKELKENGFITCDSVNTENYSRRIQVQKLAEIITKINLIKNGTKL